MFDVEKLRRMIEQGDWRSVARYLNGPADIFPRLSSPPPWDLDRKWPGWRDLPFQALGPNHIPTSCVAGHRRRFDPSRPHGFKLRPHGVRETLLSCLGWKGRSVDSMPPLQVIGLRSRDALEYYVVNGRHRAYVARLLDLPTLPVAGYVYDYDALPDSG